MNSKDQRKRFWMNVLIAVLDVLAVNSAYLIALCVRFYGNISLSTSFQHYLNIWAGFAPIYTVICIIVFAYFRLYNGMWKYAGLHDFNNILLASVTASIIHTLGTWIFIERMPMTYYGLGAFLQFVFICGIRMGYRIFQMEKEKIRHIVAPSENVMIVGYGSHARRVMDYLENDKSHNFRPACIIDDKNKLSGVSMNGVPVIGGREQIPAGIERYKVKSICISDPTMKREVREEIQSLCGKEIAFHDYSGFFTNLGGKLSLTELLSAVHTEVVIELDGRTMEFRNGEEALQNLNERYTVVEIKGNSLTIQLEKNDGTNKEDALQAAYASVVGE